MKNYRFTILFIFTIIFIPFSVEAEKETITIAAVQLQTIDAGNFKKMRELVKRAKSQGADLVIFPEESVFSWLNPLVFLEAAPIPGKYSSEFAVIARDESIWLAVGLGERGPKADRGALENAYQAYNSGILISPDGQIVLHNRQFQVVKNSFEPEACQQILNEAQCSYTPGNLSDINVVNTPFGRTSILVCSDAFVYPSHQVLDMVKELQPDFVIIFWGITASQRCECGTQGFDAASYTNDVARYLGGAYVIGVNGTGTRYHGRFLPSEYCGGSGYATPGAQMTESTKSFEELVFFHIDKYSEAL